MFDFNNNYQKIQELIRNYRAIKRRATELFDEREIYNHQKAELFARFGIDMEMLQTVKPESIQSRN